MRWPHGPFIYSSIPFPPKTQDLQGPQDSSIPQHSYPLPLLLSHSFQPSDTPSSAVPQDLCASCSRSLEGPSLPRFALAAGLFCCHLRWKVAFSEWPSLALLVTGPLLAAPSPHPTQARHVIAGFLFFESCAQAPANWVHIQFGHQD